MSDLDSNALADGAAEQAAAEAKPPRPQRVDALELAGLRIDGGTQPRAEINQEAVQGYAAAMEAGDGFPPIVVFFDGVEHWLADGFHRYHAARSIGREELPAEVINGTRRDAVLFSVGANSAHGMLRTHADKRRAVETLLADSEWGLRNDYWIARACRVAHSFVWEIRQVREASLVSKTSDARPQPNSRRYINRHGQEAEMNVSAIGKSRRSPETAEAPEPPRSRTPKRDAVVAALEADPHASSAAIAGRAGAGLALVMQVRKELELPGKKNFSPQGVKTRAERFATTMDSLRGFVLGFDSIGVEEFADDPRAPRWVEQITELIAGLRRLRAKLDGGEK